jgi:hypothetical protein
MRDEVEQDRKNQQGESRTYQDAVATGAADHLLCEREQLRGHDGAEGIHDLEAADHIELA